MRDMRGVIILWNILLGNINYTDNAERVYNMG